MFFVIFFIKKVGDLRVELDQLRSSAVDDLPPPPPPSVFQSFQPVSEKDVKEVILKSKPTSCPLDPIPTSLLVESLDVLLPTITCLVNQSLTSGSFPDLFKSAVVKPLLKKPSLDVNSLKNYRPVSNLSFLSKIIEKLVLKQLLAYLNAHSLLSANQSAYRPFHSTETALTKVMNDLLLALDGGNVSILTLLDLSAAFDTIDHITLFRTLHYFFGISGSVLDWFKSYLFNRSQAVVVDGIASRRAEVIYGVPQGSVLGPVLFVMYMKPLSLLLEGHAVGNQSFADDSQLYNSSPPSDAIASAQRLQSVISDVKSWMTRNKLKLNDDKTEALMIHNPRTRTSTTTSLPPSIEVGSATIQFSSSARNLGFILSHDLSVEKHVTHVCRSAYAALRQISSIRQYLSVDATKILVCAFVLSRLDYCNALLAGCPKTLLDKLQRVQNSAARVVFKVKKRDHITPLLQTLHWLPIKARVDYKLSVLCHSFFTDSCPAYISELLTVYRPRRQLRSSTDPRVLSIPKVRTKTFGERSFAFSGPTQWNSLPPHIRSIDNAQTFKKSLKTFLFKLHFSDNV
jgi:hypothetical protein